MKHRIGILLLVLCLMLPLCACGKKASIEGKGYDTPEEAIVAYAEAIKTGDLSKLMATHAVETYVDRYDLEENIERNHVYSYRLDCPMPNDDAYSRDMNILLRQASIVQHQECRYLYVAFGEEYDLFRITVGETGDFKNASKLLRQLPQEEWLDILAEMEVGDVADYRDLDIEKSIWKGTQKHVYRDMEKYMGCDEVTGLAVEITLDGKDYYLCADLICYDGVWYVLRAGGTIGTLAGVETVAGLLPRE